MESIKDDKTHEEYRVIKHLEKQFEPSAWVDSYLVESPDGKRMVVSYLDKDKILTVKRLVAGVHRAEDEDEESGIIEETEEAYEAWAREFTENAKWSMEVNHPNIGRIYKVGFDKERGVPMVLKEFVSGMPLFNITRGLEPLQMIPLFIPLLHALHFLHSRKNVLHLNIKSNRIRAEMKEDGAFAAKFTDCGFAVPLDGPKTGRILLGTPSHMASEVALKQNEFIGVKSDLQSFGILMYQCITGVLPFLGRKAAGKNLEKLAAIVRKEDLPMPPSAMNGKCPAALDKIIMNLLCKEPADRLYATAEDIVEAFKKDFDEACENKPVTNDTIVFGK